MFRNFSFYGKNTGIKWGRTKFVHTYASDHIKTIQITIILLVGVTPRLNLHTELLYLIYKSTCYGMNCFNQELILLCVRRLFRKN